LRGRRINAGRVFRTGLSDLIIANSLVGIRDTKKSMADGKDTSGKWAWMDVFEKRGDKWVAVRSRNANVQ
jgi:hypothetical protein